MIYKVLIRPFSKSKRLLTLNEAKRLKSGYVVLKSGEIMPEHVTLEKEEIIVVLKGVGVLVAEGVEYDLKPNQLVYIPINTVHRVENRVIDDLEYVYVVAMLD